MKKILIRIFTLLFFLRLILPTVYAADQLGLQAPDVEPPAISFDEGGTELEEGLKTFEATVTDNVGVANVTLYYKGASDVAFTPKVMKRSSTDPNLYTTELTIDPVISDKLEIYIRADDVSGNSIFEGQKFSPLTYTVVPAKAAEEVVTSVTEPPAPKEEGGMSTMTMILIGVGVLALAGGGGGGGGGSEPSTGSITITTDLPGQ